MTSIKPKFKVGDIVKTSDGGVARVEAITKVKRTTMYSVLFNDGLMLEYREKDLRKLEDK